MLSQTARSRLAETHTWTELPAPRKNEVARDYHENINLSLHFPTFACLHGNGMMCDRGSSDWNVTGKPLTRQTPRRPSSAKSTRHPQARHHVQAARPPLEPGKRASCLRPAQEEGECWLRADGKRRTVKQARKTELRFLRTTSGVCDCDWLGTTVQPAHTHTHMTLGVDYSHVSSLGLRRMG